MFKIMITPLFGDTDALGHINNNVLGRWFELARNDIFKLFVPDLSTSYDDWNLIMLKTEYEFLSQIFYGHDVEIRTYVSRIGHSSFTTYHEAWQNGILCAKGKATMVHFDFNAQKSVNIPDDIRKKLEEHFYNEEEKESN
ncbi:MAG: acyl-CoA thioesterase [Methanobrevibacter wolinii]|uniref:acyl-CoA thioesterase n=1 Tax=Methanobrevibacter wolinii TaxID=190977 RepID=UPI0005B29105|nr:thioesterase family protein [Methanobrevibacter wolinii]MDD5959254.1 thioesterase family protein [Methanobrevibacter wolinii]